MTRTLGDLQILIGAADAPGAAALAQAVVTHLDANLTVVDSLESLREFALNEEFDAIIVTDRLSDGGVLPLLRDSHGVDLSRVVLCTDQTGGPWLLAACRAGIGDVLSGSPGAEALVGAVARVARTFRRRRQEQLRMRKLRDLTRRMIRDRRQLRQRVDLLCRDLVYAYRRLAEKYVATQADGALAGQGGDGGSRADDS